MVQRDAHSGGQCVRDTAKKEFFLQDRCSDNRAGFDLRDSRHINSIPVGDHLPQNGPFDRGRHRHNFDNCSVYQRDDEPQHKPVQRRSLQKG